MFRRVLDRPQKRIAALLFVLFVALLSIDLAIYLNEFWGRRASKYAGCILGASSGCPDIGYPRALVIGALLALLGVFWEHTYGRAARWIRTGE